MAVDGTDGKRRLETTVCPSRVLSEMPEAEDLILWWLESSKWDGLSGRPAGPPEWPFPGGMLHQPAKLVEAVGVLREEWPHVGVKKTKRKPKKK